MYYSTIILFFAISCFINGLYYLWVSLLLLFPLILHQKDKTYSDNIDIHFFLLIPCLNEGKIIATTVENLLSLNMPNTKVVVINDGSTDNTLEILNEIKSQHLIILNRVYPNAKQGKGKALNYAYHYVKRMIESQYTDLYETNIQSTFNDFNTREDKEGIDPSKVIIGVFDADTFIKRSLLERVAVIMDNDPKIGMIQTRIRIGSSTRYFVLPLMQDLEFFSYINQMQNLREYTGTVAAAGNGQFNRLSAMERLGEEPWSDCLLEDFDFSLRLLLKGWRTCLLQDEATYQQGVISYKKFIKQRTRWAQGCVQSMPYLSNIVKSKHLSLSGQLEIFSFLMLPWITLMSTSAMIFSWFLILYSYWFKTTALPNILSSYPLSNLLALLIIILIIIYLPGIIFSIFYWRDTKENIFRCLLAGLLIPIYNMLQTPAVLIAIFRQAIGNNAWVKTDRV